MLTGLYTLMIDGSVLVWLGYNDASQSDNMKLNENDKSKKSRNPTLTGRGRTVTLSASATRMICIAEDANVLQPWRTKES